MPYLRPIESFLTRFHEAQERAWLGYKAGKDLVLDWGRRSGKSELIVEIFIEDIEEYGKDCLYIAITQTQAREIVWQKFRERLAGDPHWKLNEARLEVSHLPSKAVISLKGADLGKDKLRGSAKRLIACDEFAFWKDPSIVKDVLVPQLADYAGQFIYTSTTKGKNHFWELKERAFKNPSKFYTSHATVFQNPFVSEEGRNKLLSEYSGIDDPLYRQEILAEYVDFNGLVFAIPQDSYVEKRWDPADLTHSFHWRGMDHGFSPDPTAAVWLAYNRRKGYFQVYSEYKKQALLVHQHCEVIRHQESYHFLDTISDIDPQLAAEYGAIGLSLTPAGKFDKESRTLRLLSALRSGRLKIASNCTALLREMMTYEWNQDGNDHLIDALIYVFTNLVVPEEPKIEPNPYPAFKTHSESYGQDFGD